MIKVVGQKKTVEETDRIFEVFKESGGVIKPHFLLTGPSGSGKSHLMKYLAEKHDIKFIDVNAAQLTKEGTAGNSLSKALSPLRQVQNKLMLVFVDEWDKLFISGNSNDSSAHESTVGVQNEFLKVLESDTASVFSDYGKYENVNTEKVLFVFAGAFNGEENITSDRLQEIGLKTEFLGRVGLIYNISPLTLENLFDILDDSLILENYLKLFDKTDREVVITDIRKHLTATYEKNTIGARAITTLVHKWFLKGGKLSDNEVKTLMFNKKLKL
jgi:ATP-dependent protease Clp ATPase subunit